jgi:hypothetical protein
VSGRHRRLRRAGALHNSVSAADAANAVDFLLYVTGVGSLIATGGEAEVSLDCPGAAKFPACSARGSGISVT